MTIKKKKAKGGFLKELFVEIGGSILLELAWWILTLIPRLIIRFIKNVF